MMNMDSIIQKRSLAEELAEQLQQQIAEGKYKVGEKLPTEPELMKIFGVGRSSVREAVRILGNMGLLSVRQGAGTFVENQTPVNEPMGRQMQRADRQDLDEMRRILEISIAEKAAQRRTLSDIERINKHLSDRKLTAGAGSLTRCIEADINFHVAIADATHNEILSGIYKSATAFLLNEFNRIYSDTSCFIASQLLHERLAKYIASGDTKKALKAAAEIVEQP